LRGSMGVKALAHITGGGFPDNIPRVLPEGICARIDLAAVPVLPIFRWLAQAGRISQPEMLRTFNCGIGMIVVVAADQARAVATILQNAGEHVVTLGRLEAGKREVAFDGELDLKEF
jgi:phosphoribosylformylglycinamidine cyclo-ligase